MIRIHHLPRARSLRLIWQCEEMGLEYETTPVSWPPNEAYLKLNPMGSIPFMEDLDTGVSLNESVAIMLYLATQYGPTPLLPGKGDPAMPRTMQFLIFGEASLGQPGNVQVAAKYMAPDEQKTNWSASDARRRMLKGFTYVASELGDGPYIAGDRFTLADISIGFGVGFARGPILDMADELPPALLAYHDRLATRPAFERAWAR